MSTQSMFLRAFWIFPVLLLFSLSAYAVDGQIKIAQTASTTFPIVIDQPGSYVLTGNVTVSEPDSNGIEIRVNSASIDLNGHAISGPGSGTGNGIFANDKTNIAVMNGAITGFGKSGVLLTGSATLGNHLVFKIRAFGNGEHGIAVSNSIVTNCTSNSNGVWGIVAGGSIVTNCVANYNGIGDLNNGIGINANSNSTISSCTTNGNGAYGISSFESLAINNQAAFNGRFGIGATTRSRIEGNNLRSNGEYGLFLDGDKNYAIKNAASNNPGGNFHVDDPANNYMPTDLAAPDAANANIGW